jgi:transcriptional regulator with XRE-family HTH domain
LLFGRALRALREERGYSQEELAERAGLHRNYVGGVERGERNVALENIVKLAAALSIRTKDLFESLPWIVNIRPEGRFSREENPWYQANDEDIPKWRAKQKGGFSFESPPSTIRFFEDLLRQTDYSNAVPESFGIHEQARASALFPLLHPL